jgi:hypothetical protein
VSVAEGHEDALSLEEEDALCLVRAMVDTLRSAGHGPSLERLLHELVLKGAVVLPGSEGLLAIAGAEIAIHQRDPGIEVNFPLSP